MAQKGIEYLQGESKRSLDIIAALGASIALSPVALGVGAVSAFDTRSVNPFLLQTRYGGFSNDQFKAWKFRTLPKTANQMAFVSYGTYDPRASKIGQALRQSGLDEMPQLINVLRGDMSMVGARPLVSEDIERNQAAAPAIFDDWFAYFQQVKAGITGESQIHRHHYRVTTPKLVRDTMEMELRYFENASLREDIKWLARTPLCMLQANTNVIENVAEGLAEIAAENPLKIPHQIADDISGVA